MTTILTLKSKIMKRMTQNTEENSQSHSPFGKWLTYFLVIFMCALSSNAQAQYVSGDTSVCPGASVNYNFAGGPWTVTVLGGGSLVPVGPTNMFTVNWGLVPGSFLIRLQNGGTTIFQRVYVEGDIAMACDDLVNVSLDGNCEAVITPGVVLEGQVYPDDAFQVTIYNTNNLPIAGNVIDYSYLGKVLKVNIRHICSGITCWGRIFIEDKFIPELECFTAPAIVDCDSIYSPENIGFPLPGGAVVKKHLTKNQCYVVTGFDLCCDVELCYYDVYKKNGCNQTYYAQVERNWSAVDCKGNKTNCIDSIYIVQGTLDSVAWPPNYDGFDRPALECDSMELPRGPYPAGWNALDNGNPSPYNEYWPSGNIRWRGTGVPMNINCDHIAITYRDIKIPVCGNSFKLLRTWRVFDWCTGRLLEHVQFIKVTDSKAPIVSCSQNYIAFPTDYYSCTGTAIVPPPSLVLDCSSTSFEVEYKLADPFGNPEGGDYRRDNISYVNGNAVITGLPKDTTWVQYIVTDACGNSTVCRIEVLIEDKLDPVAICDEHTVVSLNEQGLATLFATSVDNGSFDNCDVDSMAVRRMADWCGVSGNTTFGRSVIFCCEDLTRNPHMVVFRVWDKSGNFNDCMVSVTVQEKIAPEITCPKDITIDCGTDRHNLNIVGRATASNTCSNVVITYKDDTTSLKCEKGEIRRRWTATSLGGLIDVCDQYITIVDGNPTTVNSITWPADITINGCKAIDAHPDFTNKPILPTGPCKNLIAGYTDERFYNVGGYCIKIIRHWRVIDWCLYDVNNSNSPGEFKRDQVIFVRNTQAPIISNATCATLDTCADDFICSANVTLIGVADDDCTDDDKLIWSYRIDYDNDGSYGPVVQGNNASGSFNAGVHKIEWTVADSCGNIATCTKTLRINDCKAPTPVCKTGIISVVMPSSKSIAVPARFFDAKSFDNCTAQKDLKFSYSSNVADSVRTFTCADIDNGISDTINITVYVTDGWNRQAICNTVMILQDNSGNVCPNRFTNGGMISGLISTSNSSVLQNAHLDLFNEGKVVGAINSERTGQFTFLDLPEGEDYMLKPRKDDDVTNGITTADIVLIQKHILGIQKFTSPYQFIAADVNNTQTITASDISDLRKIILGITDTFKDGVQSWSFVKADMKFDQNDNPWLNSPWADSYTLDQLVGENKGIDFMAIKTGDVNLSAKTTELNQGTQQRSSEVLSLEFDNKPLAAGNTAYVPVYGNWNGQLAGFQFSLIFDTDKAVYKGIKSGACSVSESNLGTGQVEEGVIHMSWNQDQSLTSSTEPLFYLIFNIKQPIHENQLVQIHHGMLEAEAYTDHLDVLGITLNARNSNKSLEQAMLYQNKPNPFKDETLIGFQLPERQQAKLTVYDLRGNLVKQMDIEGQRGLNMVKLSSLDLNGIGMYFYKLETEGFSSTRRLVISN